MNIDYICGLMGNKFANILKYSCSLALMALFLYLAFRGVRLEDFISALKSTDWLLILCSMGCGLAAFLFRSLRWRQLLLPLDPDIRFWQVFDGVNIGNLANCALPLSGEVVRCAVVRTPKAGFDRILGTIAMERILDIVSVVLIAVLALLVKGGRTAAFLDENLLRPLCSNAGGVWWKILAVALVCALLLMGVFAFRDRNRVCSKIYEGLRGICRGFVSVAEVEGKALFVLYTLLIWTCYWLMCVCVTYAFPPSCSLTVADTLFIMSVGNLASFIPVPGGFGAYHYIVRLALNAIYAIPMADGLVYATLSHESQAITMICAGLACCVHRALKEKYNNTIII